MKNIRLYVEVCDGKLVQSLSNWLIYKLQEGNDWILKHKKPDKTEYIIVFRKEYYGCRVEYVPEEFLPIPYHETIRTDSNPKSEDGGMSLVDYIVEIQKDFKG